MTKDLYGILGVGKNATQDEIKKRYRKLAMELHPDKCKDEETKKKNEEKFQEITQAYSTLSDTEKRRQHDMGDSFNLNAENIFKNFGFGNFFNQKPNFQNVHVPEKIIKIKLTLEEIFEGCVKHINIDRNLFCKGCEGSGYLEKHDCAPCRGQGKIQQLSKNGNFMSVHSVNCVNCNGNGFTIIKGCGDCKGNKFYEHIDTVKISFPVGVKHHDKLTLKARGNQVGKEIFQNVIILVEEIQHNAYKRQGNNLIRTFDISFVDSIIMKEHKFLHINGDEIIFTPIDIIDPRKKYIIGGKGIINSDLYIKFNINYPTKEEFKISSLI